MAKINARSKLGDYFVAFKLVTRKQIEACHRSLLAGQMLGQAIVKAGLVEHAVCEQVAEVQRRYRKTANELQKQGVEIVLDEKSFIGDILVALGAVTVDEKEEWLKYQESERAKGNTPPRLGELLVEKGILSAAERDLAMRVQDWLRGVN
ncbi:MAG TPA: hypothetical protein V6D17_10825 [Candidatus Obscuribacterales bacterium]